MADVPGSFTDMVLRFMETVETGEDGAAPVPGVYGRVPVAG